MTRSGDQIDGACADCARTRKRSCRADLQMPVLVGPGTAAIAPAPNSSSVSWEVSLALVNEAWSEGEQRCADGVRRLRESQSGVSAVCDKAASARHDQKVDTEAPAQRAFGLPLEDA